ncbi:hypothetical protein A9Q91_01995 [Candidatus Gracilibacteria bacterium 28_42_T64]|nr:hypothetical protein A9Q91_01995 [Candidatus Gracilibacteria bacterium 28_42_T64]
MDEVDKALLLKFRESITIAIDDYKKLDIELGSNGEPSNIADEDNKYIMLDHPKCYAFEISSIDQYHFSFKINDFDSIMNRCLPEGYISITILYHRKFRKIEIKINDVYLDQKDTNSIISDDDPIIFDKLVIKWTDILKKINLVQS